MAKAVRYHLGANGPGVCSADPDNPRAKGCPFGGASGVENHFSTMAEAETAYEKQMESEGNGLVVKVAVPKPKATIAPKPSVISLTAELRGAFKNSFEELVADSSYGISHDPRYGYTADSSEGLERFKDGLLKRSGYELDPEVRYADDDREVIQSIYIEELDIEIDNDGANEDLRERGWLDGLAAEQGAAYWR